MFEQLLLPLLGGMLIGLSAILLMIFNGRIAGISGILSAALFSQKSVDKDTVEKSRRLSWQWLFFMGILLAGLLLSQFPEQFGQQAISFHFSSLPLLLIAGLLVGFGSTLGSGCTSGHGICGIGRLSPRSIIATMIFMLTGVITAIFVH